MLAAALLAGCSNAPQVERRIANIEFFGPPVNLKLGMHLRVDGLLTLDRKRNYALWFRSGSNDSSEWDCVVLRKMPWTQRIFLPSRQPNDMQARGFAATGKVAAIDVSFGSKGCVMAIDVESIKPLRMSNELANKLSLRTQDIVEQK